MAISFRIRSPFFAFTLSVAILIAMLNGVSLGQTFTTLLNLDQNTGTFPAEAFTPVADGNLYTSTMMNGANGWGTILGITPAGKPIFEYSFTGGTGNGNTPLTLGNDGNLYGVYFNTYTEAPGGVFKLTTSGQFTVLHVFNGNDGYAPYPSDKLALAPDGSFYGTTTGGGTHNMGTIFRITSSGAFNSLHSFNGTDGSSPGALTPGLDGNFYGTTYEGGSVGSGTFFRVTPTGALTVLYNFTEFSIGSPDQDGLAVDNDGDFYGTIPNGGAHKDGEIFKMTPNGDYTLLYTFSGPDGGLPFGAMTMGNDGNFYGATYGFGAFGYGTVYRFTPSGTLTTLHNFDFTDGDASYDITQYPTGVFYGTTGNGGPGGVQGGTFYSLDMGLPPFVAFQPILGKVGQTVRIGGRGLTGTTSVSFNGTEATFKVFSDRVLQATIPQGATTGPVSVVTPNEMLNGNRNFVVLP